MLPLLPWIIIGILVVIVLALLLKVVYLQKSLDEIRDEFGEHLNIKTNTLISISSRDRHAMRLVAEINSELRRLREDRLRYENGDKELRSAVTNISHDLRTPLTAICGYLELLERADKSPEVAEYLAAISNRTEAMKSLTEELFRYSVILATEDELELVDVNLTGVLEEALTGMYGAFVSRGITPEIDMPEDGVGCKGDRAALLRVMNNILSNALKYSDGDLTVRLTPDRVVTFTNTARDMSSVDVAKLFDRFFTVSAARHSTGLGLAIAKNLTEQMGGKISASYEGEKLTIRLEME